MRIAKPFIGMTALCTIFSLTMLMTSTHAAAQQVLHSFGAPKDGFRPFDGVIFDKAGNLYSTTWTGGANFDGAVVELRPKAGGGWGEGVLAIE
jgi:hypothetical protein